MTESLPFIQDAETPLSHDELEILRGQYVRDGKYATVQTKFNYAWGLIKADRSSLQDEGIQLFKDIYQESPERRRECLYYLALGNYKMGDYAEARKYNSQLLSIEPKNSQSQALKVMIEEKVSREGLIGMAIVGGIAAVGVTVVAMLMRRPNK